MYSLVTFLSTEPFSRRPTSQTKLLWPRMPPKHQILIWHCRTSNESSWSLMIAKKAIVFLHEDVRLGRSDPRPETGERHRRIPTLGVDDFDRGTRPRTAQIGCRITLKRIWARLSAHLCWRSRQDTTDAELTNKLREWGRRVDDHPVACPKPRDHTSKFEALLSAENRVHEKRLDRDDYRTGHPDSIGRSLRCARGHTGRIQLQKPRTLRI